MPILGIVASSVSGHLAPNAPTIGVATDQGTSRPYNNGQASVSFTPASTGGTATSFTVTSSPTGFTGTGSSSPILVTGLASSTSYTYTVTATNAQGTSAASSATSSVTATTVPQAPTIGTATGGNASATVAYTAGATGGSTITSFTATSSPSSITATGASPINVTGLANGTAYTFTVTATNANGTSVASSASNSVTPVLPGNFYLIQQLSPSAVSTVTFSSIPATYKSLQVRFNLVTTSATFGEIQFNSDTSTANYAMHYLSGQGSTATAGGTASGTNGYIKMFQNNTVTTYPAVGIIDVVDYANANKNKTVKTLVGANNNTTGSIEIDSGVWLSTSAITSLTLLVGAGTYTGTISLYGVL